MKDNITPAMVQRNGKIRIRKAGVKIGLHFIKELKKLRLKERNNM